MDRFRKKRPSLPGNWRAGATDAQSSLPALDMTTIYSLPASSPSSSLDSKGSDFFHSMVPRAFRSLSRGSAAQSPVSDHQVLMPPPTRKLLIKSLSRASSRDVTKHRGSNSLEGGFGRISRASTNLSSGGSANSVDWMNQTIERHTSLEADPQSLRSSKLGYMVLTADWVVVFKSKSEALSAFPQIANANAPGTRTAPALVMTPEPVHLISIRDIVAAFHAESSRPSFGIEIWWSSPYPAISFSSTQLFFSLPQERRAQMDCILELVRNKSREIPDNSTSRVGPETEDCIRRIVRTEEPSYGTTAEPEIFPVAIRASLPRDSNTRSDPKAQKAAEGTSSYLVVGVNMCYLVEIGKASATQQAPLDVKYQSFGLVALQSFQGHWAPHEERFLLRFRDPFKLPVTLELASRYYKTIIWTLMKADKFLKPAWPALWQTREIFKVGLLPEPRHVVAGGDFGGFQRTLAAYAAAYHVEAVQWEINWRTGLSPEFRVLPPPEGGKYSALQLLAVLRALRYNDYFSSLSFEDVDLSELWDRQDTTRSGDIAYMNRNCVCLSDYEACVVQQSSILHQEFHALAFASQTIRQINFTNCLRTAAIPRDETPTTVEFLTPILDLLKMGLTRCARIILKGCHLGSRDIDDLVEALRDTVSISQGPNRQPTTQPPIRIEALDISECGLSATSLRYLVAALPATGSSLQLLDASRNFGRVPVSLFSALAESFSALRSLSIACFLTGVYDQPLVPLPTLQRLQDLEDLDLSGFKLNVPTLRVLERFLSGLSNGSTRLAQANFRSLALNNCGIDGDAAGRIFKSLAGLSKFDLSLNGNPIEENIDAFTQAVGLSYAGTYNLHLDMIEFKDEVNYIKLLRALTMNKSIRFLSLAGTAPTPTEEATCIDATCEALEQFFAHNKSVCFLDMSGYSGKLDDGQLGKGFGRSLRGLAWNRSITHLRIRNQNLNDDIGTLGSVIRENEVLRSVDCENNTFNLTALGFLATCLEDNGSILDFRCSRAEEQRVLDRCVRDIPPSQAAKPKKKKKLSTASAAAAAAAADAHAAAESQRNIFQDQILLIVTKIQSCVERNIAAAEAKAAGYVLDFHESAELTGGSKGWPSLGMKMRDGATPTDAATAQSSTAQRRSTVRSSALLRGEGSDRPRAAYRVRQDDGDVVTPPLEGQDGVVVGAGAEAAARDVPTTPELMVGQLEIESPISEYGADKAAELTEGGFEKMPWATPRMMGLQTETKE